MRLIRLRLVSLVAAALVAAVFVWATATLPPARRDVPENAWVGRAGRPWARGAFHVHTTRSDGTGTTEEVAVAAARAGLDFVVFTDHGDGTRKVDPPRYLSGVLCLDGVELSTASGHYAVAGMPPSPYPLGGEARDVVDDVKRLGGFGVAAHPTSPRPSLRWSDRAAVPDAVEWLNLDSEWRDEPATRLALAALHYLIRRPETVASVLDRPAAAFSEWDRMLRRGRTVGLAAADAHARLGPHTDGEASAAATSFHLPSYYAVFCAVSVHVEIGRPFAGQPDSDAAMLLDGLRAGRVFSSVDAIASPARLDFCAEASGVSGCMGEQLPAGGPVTLRVKAPAIPGLTLALFENGDPVKEERANNLTHRANGRPAVYRVEARLSEAPGMPAVPWVVSNPIYVGPPLEGPAAARAAATSSTMLAPGRWRVEHDASSRGTLLGPENGAGGRLEFRFELGTAGARSPFAAIAHSSTPPGGSDRISLRAWATRPMRVSIQLRRPVGHDGLRWRRSIFIDETPRDVTAFFDDMRAVPPAGPLEPGNTNTLLVVVDDVNTLPGTAGTIFLENLRWESSR
ncbi:MAG: CehA/McbA family metallohydrolase [Vicinamibacterales bacterium]